MYYKRNLNSGVIHLFYKFIHKGEEGQERERQKERELERYINKEWEINGEIEKNREGKEKEISPKKIIRLKRE